MTSGRLLFKKGGGGTIAPKPVRACYQAHSMTECKQSNTKARTMLYAQFWQMSVDWDGKGSRPIEGCGDRSVIIIDARLKDATAHDIARGHCKARGFIGYTMHHGESFTRSRQMSAFIDIRTT